MFRIGEFSKVTQVPGSQLRYYDEIGLLKPATIDPSTGYRYYSAKQIADLNRILALKDLGLSLEQIQRMVTEDVSTEEIRGMLALKKAQAEQAILDELARLKQIEMRLHQIETGGRLDEYGIIVKSVPEQAYLSYRGKMGSFGEARLTMMEMFRALPGKVDQKIVGPVTAILHSEAFEDRNFELEIGFVLSEPLEIRLDLPDDRSMTMRTLPAVEQVVSATKIGMPTESFNCRSALATWMEGHGFTFSGEVREVFHVPPFPGREAEAVLELQYPIQEMDLLALPT